MEDGDPHRTGLLARLCRSQKLHQIRNLGHTPQSDTFPQSLPVPSLTQRARQWLRQETRHHHRQSIWALTRRHPRNTPRRPNRLSPPPQGIWLGPAVRPSSIIGQPPLFETPVEPSLSASPPQLPTPPSRSNPRARIRPSSWGVKYPQPSRERHLSRWLEHVPMRMDGSITYETRLESENTVPLHPLTQQSDTRRPHPCPLPHPPLAFPSPSTPQEWDYLASRYDPPHSPQPMRPPSAPPNTPYPS
jgi:hypothetical protein